MKNGFIFFALSCLYALGVIGGLGWTLYNRAWVIAAGVLALGVMAFPTLKKAWRKNEYGDSEDLSVGCKTDLPDGEYRAKGYVITVNGGVVESIEKEG